MKNDFGRLAGWRARAAVESPSHLRNDHSDGVRWTLLAMLNRMFSLPVTFLAKDLDQPGAVVVGVTGRSEGW